MQDTLERADPSTTDLEQTEALRSALESARDIRFGMAWVPGAPDLPCPLTTQQLDDEGRLWFFIDTTSALAHAVRNEGRLRLAYAEPGRQRYVSLEGRAWVVRDERRARDWWNPMAEAFFRQGPLDPALRLLSVYPERLELWEPQGSRIAQVAKVLARAAGADIAEESLGRHEVLARDGAGSLG
jgi:general stress protein 26